MLKSVAEPPALAGENGYSAGLVRGMKRPVI
jgi:hypothetical protein